MKKMYECAMARAKGMTAVDFALMKICLVAFGVLLGTQAQGRCKCKTRAAAAGVFLVSLIPLAAKFLPRERCDCGGGEEA